MLCSVAIGLSMMCPRISSGHMSHAGMDTKPLNETSFASIVKKVTVWLHRTCRIASPRYEPTELFLLLSKMSLVCCHGQIWFSVSRTSNFFFFETKFEHLSASDRIRIKQHTKQGETGRNE